MTLRFLELRVPPVAVVIAFTFALWAAARWLPGATVAIPGHRYIAFALFAAGLGIAAAGVLAFRRHGTTLNPMTPAEAATVVDSGVFRYTRNPMYLGLTLFLCGWAAWLSNLAALALVGLFMVYMTTFQIRPEERALKRVFGRSYEDYAARVRRWL